MGVPKKRRTSGQRKRRASHFALPKVQLVTDEKGNKVPQRLRKTSAKLAASKTPAKQTAAPKAKKETAEKKA